MSWGELVAADPEVIIVAPCGFGLDRCLAELPVLQAKPGWTEIDAVRNGRVFFADGNAYFNRPGPRLADSGEILAQVLHGEPEVPNYETLAWVRHKSQTAAGS
jgi:iron complex transport system substrate-binding protein